MVVFCLLVSPYLPVLFIPSTILSIHPLGLCAKKQNCLLHPWKLGERETILAVEEVEFANAGSNFGWQHLAAVATHNSLFALSFKFFLYIHLLTAFYLKVEHSSRAMQHMWAASAFSHWPLLRIGLYAYALYLFLYVYSFSQLFLLLFKYPTSLILCKAHQDLQRSNSVSYSLFPIYDYTLSSTPSWSC